MRLTTSVEHYDNVNESHAVYTSLSTDGQEIRTLELLPAINKDELIKCRLHHGFLNNSLLSYEAFSYTWGIPQPVSSVELNGTLIGVGSNLHSALRHFRHNTKSRMLWIDALCINQLDLVERSQQVAVMRQIYQRASGVLIWLGEAAHGSDLCMRWLRHIANSNRKDESNQDQYLVRNIEAATGLHSLLSRPWFTRVWIVQELVLGTDPAVYCGHEMISWASLMHAIKVIDDEGHDLFYYYNRSNRYDGSESRWRVLKHFSTKTVPSFVSARTIDASTVFDCGKQLCASRWKRSRNLGISHNVMLGLAKCLGQIYQIDQFSQYQTQLSQTQTMDFELQPEHVLEIMRGRQVSDFRDVIYGSLGLPGMTSLVPHIIPDYNKTLNELTMDVAIAIMSTGSLNFLRYCQHRRSKNGAEIALWVPAWYGERESAMLADFSIHQTLSPYKACGDLQTKFTYTEQGSKLYELIAQGVIVDTIEDCTAFDYGERHDDQGYNCETAALSCSTQSNGNEPTEARFGDDCFQRSWQGIRQREVPRPAAVYNGSLMRLNRSGQTPKVPRLVIRERDMQAAVYKTKESIWLAYLRTLVADRCGNQSFQYESVEHLLWNLEQFKMESKASKTDLWWSDDLRKRLQTSMRNKVLITTKTQYMGLAPCNVKPTDLVVVLCGVNVPLVIRRQEGERSFEIIGEAYVHGIMNGELFSVPESVPKSRKFRFQ